MSCGMELSSPKYSAALVGVFLLISGPCGAIQADAEPTLPPFETLWSPERVEPTFTRPEVQSLFLTATPPAQDPAGPDATASTHPRSADGGPKTPGKVIKELLGVTPAESAEEGPQNAPEQAAAPQPESPAPPPTEAAAPQPTQPTPQREVVAPQPAMPAPPQREAVAPRPESPAPPQREAVAPRPNAVPPRQALTHVPAASPQPAHGGRRIGVTRASYYKHSGRTASGETYRPNGLTAAHRTLPLGTRLRVVNPRNGRSVVVRINDRVPRTAKNPLDLSLGSAKAIGITKVGIAPVALYTVH